MTDTINVETLAAFKSTPGTNLDNVVLNIATVKSTDESATNVTATTVQRTDTLDHLLLQTVSEHPFSVSGGALIICITFLKIIKELRGK
ncbi:MAG: hypothetical protein LBJ89_04045 [Holosporales bacterium]|jgi:hypothetical protein|nr:hypothetical protein [Holosporales bacterium]